MTGVLGWSWHGLELKRGVSIGQQIGTDGREARPRLDWTREKRYTPKPHVCGAEKSLEGVRFAFGGRCADNVFLSCSSRAVGGNPKNFVTLCGIDSGCNVITTAPSHM